MTLPPRSRELGSKRENALPVDSGRALFATTTLALPGYTIRSGYCTQPIAMVASAQRTPPVVAIWRANRQSTACREPMPDIVHDDGQTVNGLER